MNSSVKSISDQAEKLYNYINEYYTFLIESITPENYSILKQEFYYPESYEDHIQSLLETVPSADTTKHQIQQFLNKYIEFYDETYCYILKSMNEKLVNNAQQLQINAFEIMKNNNEGFQTRKQQHENDFFSCKIQNTTFTIPTFNNPLLTSLYSLLLTWFSLKEYGEPPELLSTQ